METTHTQGEWLFSKGSTPHFQCQVYSQETGQTIAVTYNDEGQHNARLIAAAPELLEALQKLVQFVEWRQDFIVEDHELGESNQYSEALSAIQKATQP